MKEYNYSEYSEKIVKKRMTKHGGMKEAIVAMDAQIASLKVEADALREMVDWDIEEDYVVINDDGQMYNPTNIREGEEE